MRLCTFLVAGAAALDVGVSCSGFSDYQIADPFGSLAVGDPTITVVAGDVLTFVVDPSCNGAPNHPFQIRAGPVPTPAPYTLGVTGAGATNGNVTLVTTPQTLTQLSYQCVNHPGMQGNIIVQNGIVKAGTPSILASNAQLNSIDLTWTPGLSNCSFSSWLIVQTPGSISANCQGIGVRGTITCTAGGLSSNTNYGFTVQEVCTNSFASSVTSGMNSLSTLTNPATNPTSVMIDSVTDTTASLSWTAGTGNDCNWNKWQVVFVSGGSGPVASCQTFANRQTVSCTATGLTPYTSYSFGVSEICTNPAGNSVQSAASPTMKTIISAPITLNLATPTLSSLVLTWTSGALQCATFAYWDVQTSTGGSVAGCLNAALTTRAVSLCNATGLLSATSYTFKVREVCADSTSAFTTSNALATSAAPIPPIVVLINCSVGDTSHYFVNGTANAPLTVAAGALIHFTLNGCEADPFVIQRFGAAASGALLAQLTVNGAGNATSGIRNGTLVFNTSTSTPMHLTYRSNAHAAMTGTITIVGGTFVAASAPSTPTTVAGMDTASINWNAGTGNNDCVFASWIVTGSPSGSCVSNSSSGTNCTVTGLSPNTRYTFTVKQTCSNVGANSPDSSSTAMTTLWLGAVVYCANGGTCNCGNASSCTCQNTDICNCQNADVCTCQLGVCNGGYARLFFCESATCNKQCASQCMGLCLPTIPGNPLTGRRLFGTEGCVAAAPGLSASAFVLAVLGLLAVLQ